MTHAHAYIFYQKKNLLRFKKGILITYIVDNNNNNNNNSNDVDDKEKEEEDKDVNYMHTL